MQDKGSLFDHYVDSKKEQDRAPGGVHGLGCNERTMIQARPRLASDASGEHG